MEKLKKILSTGLISALVLTGCKDIQENYNLPDTSNPNIKIHYLGNDIIVEEKTPEYTSYSNIPIKKTSNNLEEKTTRLSKFDKAKEEINSIDYDNFMRETIDRIIIDGTRVADNELFKESANDYEKLHRLSPYFEQLVQKIALIAYEPGEDIMENIKQSESKIKLYVEGFLGTPDSLIKPKYLYQSKGIKDSKETHFRGDISLAKKSIALKQRLENL